MPLPASWAAAIKDGRFWATRSDTMGSTLAANDGSSVLTALPEGDRVHLIMAGRDRRVVTEMGTIDRLPGTPGGLGFATADRDHIAFVFDYTNDADAANVWALYLWNEHTRRLRLVARSQTGPNGKHWAGGFVRPTLSRKYLYWVQAIKPLPGLVRSSALMQYDIASGRTRRLAYGLIDQSVAFGSSVLFTAGNVHNPGDSAEVLTALDATTGKRVPPPAGLSMARDHPGEISTDGTTIVWTSNAGLHGWRQSWGRSIKLMPIGAEDPMVAGDLITFNFIAETIEGDGPSVLDLRTNSYARLNHSIMGGVMANGTILSLTDAGNKNAPHDPSGAFAFAEYVFDVRHLSPLPACTK